MSKIKYKIGYLVTEPGCLTPGSGAFQHIKIGLKELSSHFEVVPLFEFPGTTKNQTVASQATKKSRWYKRTYIWGTLKDIGPNQIWVSDLNYIRVRHRWVYLTIVMDLWGREIVVSHR